MRQKHSIDFLFSLSLFAVFVIGSFFILLLQTNGYRSMIQQEEALENTHTPLAYVVSKIRTMDEKNAIDTVRVHGQTALLLKDASAGTFTYIYEDNNELKELHIIDTIEPDFSTGISLFKATSFHVTKNGSKVTLHLQNENKDMQNVTITLRSE